MSEREHLEQAIAAFETQRAVLGDAIVDAALAPLRQKLAAMQAQGLTEQQRKQITVLFADISGFTAMSETLDAEDVADTMNALWQRLDSIITAHGGLIDKHIGDAVMALWGTQATREDDPERALHAALAMQAALTIFRDEQQVALQMRIGVNTGPVLLGAVGSTAEFTAMGDTVNVASRLEHAAPIGGILVAYDTYRHVRGLFIVQELSPLTVKGKREPLQVYLVQQASPHGFQPRTRGVEGVETRMIGRERELKGLQDALVRVIDAGERQQITIVAEAGRGKSRLLYEFVRWVESLPQALVSFKGRASPSMQHLPYALLRDLFAFRCQIQDSDSAPVVREKIERSMEDVFGAEVETQMRAHSIGHLLGFAFGDSAHLHTALDNPRQFHNRALTYLVGYFNALAARSPIVMLDEAAAAGAAARGVAADLAASLPEVALRERFLHGVEAQLSQILPSSP
jgi:class 3 adenylate cyclase